MAAHAVFVISNQGLDLWTVSGLSAPRHAAFFSDPERDAEALAALARRTARLRVRVLADLVEEDFRIEQVARLHGRDHRALVERHLRREFRETPYRMLCSRLRVPEDARRETLVLCGIIAPAQVDRWLEPLARAGCQVTGVHGASDLCRRLFSRLPAARRRGMRLFATLNRHGGLRISLFDQGRLRFSRMSVHDPEESSLRDFLHQELRRSRRFYENLRLVERGRPLQCLFVADEGGEVEAAEIEEGLTVETVSGVRLGLAVGRRRPDGLHADPLLVELAVRSPPAGAYASDAQRRARRRQLAVRTAWQASAASLFASLAYGGLVAIDMQSMRQTRQALLEARSMLSAQIDRVQAEMPHFPAPVELMERAVEIASGVHARRGVTTLQTLGRVGQVLERHPGFRLRMLAWRNEAPVSAGQDEDSQATPMAVATLLERSRGGADRFLLMKGSYPVDPSDLSTTALRLERLVAALRGIDGIGEVEILENPVDPADSGEAFSQVGLRGQETPRAPLTLLLRLEPS